MRDNPQYTHSFNNLSDTARSFQVSQVRSSDHWSLHTSGCRWWHITGCTLSMNCLVVRRRRLRCFLPCHTSAYTILPTWALCWYKLVLQDQLSLWMKTTSLFNSLTKSIKEHQSIPTGRANKSIPLQSLAVNSSMV